MIPIPVACFVCTALADTLGLAWETVIRRSSDPTPERRAILIQLSLPNSRKTVDRAHIDREMRTMVDATHFGLRS